MPEGKIIPATPEEYPELQGLKEGAQIDFNGTARLVQGGLEIMNIELDPSDNEATTELNRMTGGNDRTVPPKASGSQGF